MPSCTSSNKLTRGKNQRVTHNLNNPKMDGVEHWAGQLALLILKLDIASQNQWEVLFINNSLAGGDIYFPATYKVLN